MRQLVEHEHGFEEVPGIPGRLPKGERVLWQGKPDWVNFAIHVFHIRFIALYFAVIAAWRVWDGITAARPAAETIGSALYMIVLGTIAIALLSLYAWAISKTTVYSLTNRRVLMRMGVALPLTLNLPFSKVASASLKVRKGEKENGNLAFAALPDERLSYLILWPHVRPFRIGRAEPALRCINNAHEVGAIVSEALKTAQDNQADIAGMTAEAQTRNADATMRGAASDFVTDATPIKAGTVPETTTDTIAKDRARVAQSGAVPAE
ncbi:MAG: photosynthetic complex putative assembly protein PuhB [Pseudomonadota bacterium]